MPAANDVTPAKWRSIEVLFDDGTYSVIAGEFEGNWGLGQRWNGKGEGLGFPTSSGDPVWHVVPTFLIIPVLHGVLAELSRASRLDKEKIRAVGAALNDGGSRSGA